MSQIATREPTSLRAGETLTFSRSLPDYSAASGWSITYYFTGVNGQFSFTSANSGGAHLVTVAASATALYLAGDYYGSGIVSDGTTKVEVYSGKLTVKPDLSTAAPGQDLRSQNRRILDNVNAALEGKATHDILNSDVEGTKIERLTPEQLLKLRDRYAQLVAAEEAAEQGRPTRKNILIRFQ